LYCSEKKNYPSRFHRRIILMAPALGVNATSTMLNFIIKRKAKWKIQFCRPIKTLWRRGRQILYQNHENSKKEAEKKGKGKQINCQEIQQLQEIKIRMSPGQVGSADLLSNPTHLRTKILGRAVTQTKSGTQSNKQLMAREGTTGTLPGHVWWPRKFEGLRSRQGRNSSIRQNNCIA